jgi:HlyD family secretion protein
MEKNIEKKSNNSPALKGKFPHIWSSGSSYIRKHKIISLIALIVVVGIIYWFFKKTNSASAQTRYVTATVQDSTVISSVSGTGQVSAETDITLKPLASGTIIALPVQDGQSVRAGDLIAEIDPSNAEQSVQNAKASLESAQLSLEKLQEPPTQLQITQDQDAITEAQQSEQVDQANLSKDYDDAFTEVSNAFLDLPTVVTGVDNTLYKTNSNGQDNASYYSDLVSNIAPDVTTYETSATTDYAAASTAYQQNFLDYKATSRNAATSTIIALLNETYTTTKLVSDSVKSSNDLFSFVNQQLTNDNKQVPAALNGYQTTLAGYTNTIDADLTSLLNSINSITSDQNALTNDRLSYTEKTETLQQLQTGPDPLDIQSSQLQVTQAQNSLADAEQTLQNYYVTAPFDGVVSNITATVGDQSGSSVATLTTTQQIAQITLNEVDAAKIQVGDQATLTFDAVPGLSIAGKVSEIDTVGTVSQGVVTYGVKIAFDTSDSRIKPGMSVSANIVTNIDQNVLVVPNAAIQTQGATSYVQVFNPPLANSTGNTGVVSAVLPQDVMVQVGNSNNTQTEIVSGLTAGEQVVTRTITSSSGTTASAATAATTRTIGGGGSFGGGGVRGVTI